MEPPPLQAEDGGEIKPQDEKEIKDAKRRKQKANGASTGNGRRPLASGGVILVKRGTMSAAEFAIELECPLAGGEQESPKQVFDDAIKRLRSKGAEITPEGEAAIAYLMNLGTVASTMKAMADIMFRNTATVSSVLREGAQRLRREAKAEAKKNPPPESTGEADQPSAGE